MRVLPQWNSRCKGKKSLVGKGMIQKLFVGDSRCYMAQKKHTWVWWWSEPFPRHHVSHAYMTEQASQMLTVWCAWLRRSYLRIIIWDASVANEQLLFMTGKVAGSSIKFDPSWTWFSHPSLDQRKFCFKCLPVKCKIKSSLKGKCNEKSRKAVTLIKRIHWG